MKNIIIMPEETVGELYLKFESLYANLKIKLYFRGQEIIQQYSKSLKSISNKIKPVSFVIKESDGVEEIENLFFEYLGLQVSINKIDCENCRYLRFNSTVSLSDINTCSAFNLNNN